MKTRSILVITLLVVASIGLTIFSIVNGFDNTLVNVLIAITPLIVFYIQFLVENMNKAFILWNKAKTWILNPGLEWQITSYIVYDSIDQEKLLNLFSNILSDPDYKELVGEEMQKVSERGNTLAIKIGLTLFTISAIDQSTIKISSSSNINYRESKDVINKHFKYLSRMIDMTLNSVAKESSFSLKIKFRKENPYYGLYVRRLDNSELSSFILKYSIDNMKFVVSNNSIEVTCKSFETIEKISSDFLVISNN
ncbi:hypothetical protein [Enterococcus sp. AZ192]|uniref:hypothetical protein n=1 Tax=unclassified Enterococcus TaxID=2608891 RepID=UPI003D2705F1